MLSFCIIYNEKDERFLQGCLNSIPEGSEIVLCKTIPNDNILFQRPVLKKVGESEQGSRKIIHSTWDYMHLGGEYDYSQSNFSFAEARNACKALATGNWIVSIDADERFVCDRSELEIFDKLQPDIGGLIVHITSLIIENNKNCYGVKPVLRIFKNDTRFRWINRCHEQIVMSLAQYGYKFLYSAFMIRHLGYERYFIKDEGDKKRFRNIALMASDLKRFDCADPNIQNTMFRQLQQIEELGKRGVIETQEPDLPDLLSYNPNFLKYGIDINFNLSEVVSNIQSLSCILESNPMNKQVLQSQLINLKILKKYGGINESLLS